MLKKWTETQNNRMENVSFHSQAVCDRCNEVKPIGRDGLDWLFIARVIGSKNQIDVCPACQTKKDNEDVVRQLGQYVHHSIWRDGSLIGRKLRSIKAEQDALEKDCRKARELLEKLNPVNKQSHLNKIGRALASAGIKCV